MISDSALALSLSYPDSFLQGRYEADPGIPDGTNSEQLKHALVFVLPEDLGDHKLSAIPIGEVPVIWIDRLSDADLVFRLFQPDSTYSAGTMRVFRFPGYPGPYGDRAHYYLVQWPDSSYIEIGADRYRVMGNHQTLTDYGQVIEALIPTLLRL
jgi:hypothetical protein